jgi:hypothetical protein
MLGGTVNFMMRRMEDYDNTYYFIHINFALTLAFTHTIS